MYDANLGRFFTQDRFAEKYYSISPMQYGANNPISTIDINGDIIWVVFSGKDSQKALNQVKKLFSEEFGLNVGYNSKTNMLYWESDVENPELSQSKDATDYLKSALTDTNSQKGGRGKHGRIEFGYNLSSISGGPVVGGAWHSGTTQIDFADFDKNGGWKKFSYHNLDVRAYNIARVFEHEYLGHDRYAVGGFGDGSAYTLGRVAGITNGYRRDRKLPERLHYGDAWTDRILFGNTGDYENPKAMKKYVKKALKGIIQHNSYMKKKIRK